jgi:hypothetical protein
MTIHGGVLDALTDPIVTTGSKMNKEVINGH